MIPPERREYLVRLLAHRTVVDMLAQSIDDELAGDREVHDALMIAPEFGGEEPPGECLVSDARRLAVRIFDRGKFDEFIAWCAHDAAGAEVSDDDWALVTGRFDVAEDDEHPVRTVLGARKLLPALLDVEQRLREYFGDALAGRPRLDADWGDVNPAVPSPGAWYQSWVRLVVVVPVRTTVDEVCVHGDRFYDWYAGRGVDLVLVAGFTKDKP